MDSSVSLIWALTFALIGWLASCHAIVHSKLRPQLRRWLVIPAWFAWVGFALGGPVWYGTIPLNDAMSAGFGMTFGMTIVMVMNARRGSRAR